ncbi:MAG: hypothetical protein AB1918_13880 [Pseudomonadota bacterium]
MSQGVSAGVLPYEAQCLPGMPEWRNGLRWPVNYMGLRQPGIDIALTALRLIGQVEDRLLRDSLLLVAHRIVPLAIWKMEAAHTAAACPRMSFRTPELAFVVGQADEPARPAIAEGLVKVAPAGGGLRGFLRRVKWTGAWTPWPKVPLALLTGEREIASTGSLLLRHQKATGFQAAFRPAQDTLLAARRDASFEPPKTWGPVIGDLLDQLAALSGLDQPHRGRLRRSLDADMTALMAVAGRDMAALRKIRLPRVLWTATGSKHAPRALGLEVMRRGGEVVRFCHGGTHGLVRSFGQVASLELAVSTELVASSERQAELIRSSGEIELVAPYNPGIQVTAGHGEPTIARFAETLPPRRARARPKVVFVLSPLVEFVAKPASKILNNVLALDFNAHVLEELRRLDAEVVCKPHPEGMFPGRLHPLNDPVVPGDTPFAQVVADADVIVVDQPFSTAFWQMMSTDRGLVYIDTGLAEFHPELTAAIRSRCQVVEAFVDGDNRFRVDPAALSAAVEAAATGTVDPGIFNDLHC